MTKKIVVIGSSNVDLIMKMNHLPSKGETVTNAEFMQVYGGKGANQAVAAARAGGDVAFISSVGDDAYTPQMIQNYKEDGIDTSCIFIEENKSSGHALIMIGDEGDNYISVAPEANYLLSPERIDLAKQVIEDAAMIIMQYEIPEETIKYVIDIANQRDILVLLNFAPARNFDLSYIPRVNTLVVNEVEAGFLAEVPVENEEDAEKAANILLQKGVDTIILTLGSKGAIMISENERIFTSAFKVNAIDTTAAGDTFCGSFAVAIAEGKSKEESIRFASAASAICVTKMGAQPAVPGRDEIDSFLSEQK